MTLGLIREPVAFGAAAALLSLLLAPVVRRLAPRLRAIDVPHGERKRHARPTPLLGGWAVYLAFVLALALYLALGSPDLLLIPPRFLLGLCVGGAILVLGGYLDDRYELPAHLSVLAPALAAVAVVASGIGVGLTQLSNPFGEPLSLSFAVLGVPAAALFTWLWVMGMTYTTKFLDGLDGLCAGVSAIAALTLAALSLTDKIGQPMTAALAAILAGSFAGFLFFNWKPASIFLGESGSTFAGFALATLSVILGGKVATAFLVMGIPILDVAWAIVRRLWYGASPFSGDRGHLHYRLVDVGLSERQAVLVLYGISAAFGIAAVVLQSIGKLVALVALLCVMVAIAMVLVIVYKRRRPAA